MFESLNSEEEEIYLVGSSVDSSEYNDIDIVVSSDDPLSTIEVLLKDIGLWDRNNQSILDYCNKVAEQFSVCDYHEGPTDYGIELEWMGARFDILFEGGPSEEYARL